MLDQSDLTDPERDQLKQFLQEEFAAKLDPIVAGDLVNFFLTPLEATPLQKTPYHQQWPVLQKKIRQAGHHQRQFFVVLVVIIGGIILFSIPNFGLGLFISLLVFLIWVWISRTFLKVKLTAHDRKVLLAHYGDQSAQWQYEYFQLRAKLLVAIKAQNLTQIRLFIREMIRYLHEGILILNAPRLLTANRREMSTK